MNKRVLSLINLILLNKVSAQGDLSYYLYQIDPSTVILIAAFLITFALISLSLKRVFKNPEEKKNAYIIALIVAVLVAYGINRIDFYWGQNWFYNIEYFFTNWDTGTGIAASVIIIFLVILFYEIKTKKSL